MWFGPQALALILALTLALSTVHGRCYRPSAQHNGADKARQRLVQQKETKFGSRPITRAWWLQASLLTNLISDSIIKLNATHLTNKMGRSPQACVNSSSGLELNTATIKS